MGLMYSAVFNGVAVSAITDLFWMGAPTDAIVVIHEITVTQEAQETSEQLPLLIFRTTTDNSAQGTSVTANPLEVGFPAHGSVVRRSITGGNLSAETTILRRLSQNLVNGWHYLFTPETRIVLSPTAGTAGRLAIKLPTAPGASITLDAELIFEEIGG